MQRRSFCQFAALGLAALPFARPRSPTMKLTPIRPDDNAFAMACEVSGHSRLLFVSGQVPEDAEGRIPATYPEQYRLAWANVLAQLQAAGMSYDNLVKATIYLSDRSLIAQSGGLRKSVLGDRTPAITIVIVGIYDERWLLEIEAIAAA